jgi:hypothetical protein
VRDFVRAYVCVCRVCERVYVGLAIIVYIRCIHGIFGRGITNKYTLFLAGKSLMDIRSCRVYIYKVLANPMYMCVCVRVCMHAHVCVCKHAHVCVCVCEIDIN